MDLSHRSLLLVVLDAIGNDGWTLRALVRTCSALHRRVVAICPGYWMGRLRRIAPHVVHMGDSERRCFWLCVRWLTTHRQLLSCNDTDYFLVDPDSGTVRSSCRHLQRAARKWSRDEVRSIAQVCLTRHHLVVRTYDGRVAGAFLSPYVWYAARFLMDHLQHQKVVCVCEFDSLALVLTDDGRVERPYHDVRDDRLDELNAALGDGQRYVQLSVANGSIAALRNDGHLAVAGEVCHWGIEAHVPVSSFDPPPGRHFVQVVAAPSHMLALLDDGTIKGWGSNVSGEIAGVDAAVVPMGHRRIVQLSATLGKSAALLDDGQITAWGRGLTDCARLDHANWPLDAPCSQVSLAKTFVCGSLVHGEAQVLRHAFAQECAQGEECETCHPVGYGAAVERAFRQTNS